MARPRDVFCQLKTAPSPVETDEIYPLHMLDDTKTLRGIVVTWTLRFNNVLDADKLHSSLSELLEIGDWRKMGTRTDERAVEIHVPRPFTAERPAVAYSQEILAVDIEKHELARALPKGTDRASVQPGPGEFRAFAARKGAPEALDDFIYHDVPQLSLHITLFNDATLVSLSWPHTLMGVMGQQGLLRGWSMVLAGRVSDVPPVLGAREEAIRAAVDAPVEAKEDFKVGQSFERMGGKRHLLTAWVARALTSSLPQPRPVTVLHALNARFRISSLANSPVVYIQNMAVAAFASLPEDSHTKSLVHVALENRQHLVEQATEGQVLAFLRELLQNAKTGGDPNILCCPSDAVLLPFTNWERANIFKTADFSPAVVRAGEMGPLRNNAPGTIVYHHADSMRSSSAVRDVVVVLGKDHGGNYWLNGVLLPSTWLKIREDIERM
ncbi:uncharacterized protein F5Z01DRAFT_744242 [Emericellopsis atlantica]|uniref:Uncharacterized protein n=1 Tax=Emericellopsis atlantica TaxID=2614577 RepID=A0A9P7ZJK7_9HYPO|nr:uncharacterized protein F5Z01DRAFT_744242 [Emericellopsis atlantica]KAG9252678.1 hypothetical protein F5Z01DRAFT_744242 [Emericellopsis atlantica]